MAKIQDLVDILNCKMLGVHAACAGCMPALTFRYILNTVASLGKIIIVITPAGCWTINSGRYPYFAGQDKFTQILELFASAAAMASAISCVFKDRRGREDVVVVVWAGDGSFDIGLAAVSAALQRNHKLIFMLNNTEVYSNTGGQASGLTPKGARTVTTPKGNEVTPKNMTEIVCAHSVPYYATACAGSKPLLDDLVAKIKNAVHAQESGSAFLHLLNPCAPALEFPTSEGISVAKAAVETNSFPLMECEHGRAYRITYRPKKVLPVWEYLKLQGRFSHLTEDSQEVKEIQAFVDDNYSWLEDLERLSIDRQSKSKSIIA
ncbi:MAG: pyruvate synthase subunit beta [Candidatus Niyogibacteria bacterium]|nr:pyruvate synthase subunit beta [Candidatus Niyogibacteria bacterium]